MSEWYYFLHIPKTAGTTFRFVLYDYFDQSEIYPNYYELAVHQKSRYLGWKKYKEKEKSLFHNGKKILIAHFGWLAMNHYKDHPPKTLTFLRDPIKRVKSAIIYLQQSGRMYEGLTIDEIINDYVIREGSMHARQMGYRPKRDNMSQALKNLESIDFIGISERFDDSLTLCNYTFGWDLQPIPKRNVGSYKPDEFTPEQIEKITKACEIDYIIYHRGVELFEERLAAMKKA